MPAPAPGAPGGDAPEFVPGELLVQFDPGTSRSRQRAVVRSEKASVIEHLDGGPSVALVGLPPGLGVRAADRAFEADARVRRAQPNFVYELEAVPNDPLFGSLWGLHNTGLSGGTVDADIDAPEAWDYPPNDPATTTGSGAQTVAVIDTGLQADHVDLAPNFADGWDFVEDDPVPDDAHGHGTHVSGTVGAQGNNGLGVTGVNWDVSLMALKAGRVDGFLHSAEVIAAIRYARDNGADVVNASFSGPSFDGLQRDEIAAAPGVLFVAAAGNDASSVDLDPEYPCAYDLANVICVAASTQFDGLASYSNFGPTSVDLAAPGGSGLGAGRVLSTIRTYANKFSDNFETPWVPWTSSHPNTWDRTSLASDSGQFSLTDSPGGNYENDANVSASTAAGINVTEPDACRVDFDARYALSDSDRVFLEAATDASFADAEQLLQLTGTTQAAFKPFAGDVPDLAGPADIYLRFRLRSDGAGVADGIYVDDVVLSCASAEQQQYDFLNGTSMATPHVAGAAALLLAAHPAYHVADLRNALLNTVDQRSAFACAVATGGRLNLNAAIQEGANAAPAPPPSCQPGAPSSAQQQAGATDDGDGAGDAEDVPRCGGKKATIVGTERTDRIKGTKRADVIAAGAGADRVFGGGGDDRICGEGGKDRLFGGKGKDRLFGGKGKDRLFGGKGKDRLAGGADRDRQSQ